jgi:Tfp pilus assembly protein PilF
LALDLARRYIALGRADSDPRYYGYAEAVLSPWLEPRGAWPEALVLRATVLQNRHAFEPALADLDDALRKNPRLAQAWLVRASIQEVRGDYPGALRSCLALAKLAESLASMVCLNSALSLAGQAESAYVRLRSVLEKVQGSSRHSWEDRLRAKDESQELLWGWTTLGEMAERLGRPEAAEEAYRAALALGLRSAYLFATYADFLLDRGRPAEAAALLENEVRADPLLLRLTLAEQRLRHPAFAAHAADLKARFEASRLRKDATHQGDESRYALYVERDTAEALRLALANWSVQREPRDARLLLEAARAAGRPEAAAPVLEFLTRTRLEDARLAPLLADLGGRASPALPETPFAIGGGP